MVGMPSLLDLPSSAAMRLFEITSRGYLAHNGWSSFPSLGVTRDSWPRTMPRPRC